ncbi:MAG TPA: hypothetical protein VGI41_06655 [Candidatus Udaeobacter sp.]
MLARHIAQNGHVIQFKVEPIAEPLTGLFVAPKRVGLNEATTFFGFCDKHDSVLFHPLESTQFNFQPKQIALLGYRAVCRDLYQKEAEIAGADAMRNYIAVNPDIPGFRQKDFRHQIMRVARLNAQKNLSRARDAFAKLLAPGGEKSLRYFAIHFSDVPVYFASSAFLPEWDFNGNKLQDLSRLDDFYPICFSVWAKGNESAVVFCWHKSADNVCNPFIDSLRESQAHRLANRILGMAFEYSENIVFRADWWESIPHRDQQYLAKRVMSGVEDSTRTAKSLLDGGLRALGSNVVATHVRYE